jgi:hypothetical protein
MIKIAIVSSRLAKVECHRAVYVIPLADVDASKNMIITL